MVTYRIAGSKPATWIPLIWGVACGAAASGSYHAIWNLFGDAPTTDSWGEVGVDTIKALAAMVLAGPFMCGFTQTINDWYDRDLDAINEPYRPIPSGKIKGWEIATQVAFLLGGGGLLAWNLDGWAGNDWPVITFVAALGTLLAYIYSAPPLKLKSEGWLGTYALGSSYIALPWWCGHAMFDAASIGYQEVVLTILYSIAGLGIAIVNDFKSIEGDRELGMNSLPVAFGVDTAKYICVASIDLTQLGVAAYLYAIGETTFALILLGLILPQMFSQISFLQVRSDAHVARCGPETRDRTRGSDGLADAPPPSPCRATHFPAPPHALPRPLVQDPVANDVKYQAAAQPFLVLGILTTALAVGHHSF